MDLYIIDHTYSFVKDFQALPALLMSASALLSGPLHLGTVPISAALAEAALLHRTGPERRVTDEEVPRDVETWPPRMWRGNTDFPP